VARRGILAWVVVAALVGGGCGRTVAPPPVPRPGIVHEVRSGENLYRIGRAYGVAHEELARVNRLANANRLHVGQRLFIPGGARRLPVNLITPERAFAGAPALEDLPQGNGVFIWPLERGVVTSRFGPRGRGHHDGIDIGAPAGTSVRCARDGEVIYSDELRGYGNVVIVRHHDGYATVYAHNAENLVHEGVPVRQGDVVGRVGQTGRTTGPNLHFEIRKDNVARNPIYFLPTQTAQHGRDPAT